MIRHDILIEKLSNAGIKDNLLLLYKNYFSNRQFCVQNGTTESGMELMNDGAPQGSILSGLIFILYINSITKTFKQCQAVLYADDLVIMFSNESPQ